jgi:hypothetical protein
MANRSHSLERQLDGQPVCGRCRRYVVCHTHSPYRLVATGNGMASVFEIVPYGDKPYWSEVPNGGSLLLQEMLDNLRDNFPAGDVIAAVRAGTRKYGQQWLAGVIEAATADDDPARATT